jgi:toxin-antitoxin system PIN domain toxin
VDLCDSSVWLALALSTHSHHAAAGEWFDAVPDPGSVVFCRATQQTFLRLLTNASVLSPYGNPPLTNRQAWEAYQALLADERITFRSDEPAGLETLWRRFAVRGTASPKLWMDAYLAAFALSGGYRMVTTDGAFKQFAGLDLELLGEHG